jgi:hypothetical protein
MPARISDARSSSETGATGAPCRRSGGISAAATGQVVAAALRTGRPEETDIRAYRSTVKTNKAFFSGLFIVAFQ